MDPLQCAIETARAAGDVLLERVGMPLEAAEKGLRGDLVTASDRASEALIVARLRAAFPDAAILGEEGGATAGTSDERWIVDPLDGTTNYAHDYPLYCVSIAYERGGELVVAAIYAPALRELYAAQRGRGATLNGTRIVVSETATLAESLVCTGFIPARYERNGENFARLSRVAQGVRRDGSAALDLAFVAAGPIRRILGIRFTCVGCGGGRSARSRSGRHRQRDRRRSLRRCRCVGSREQRRRARRNARRPCWKRGSNPRFLARSSSSSEGAD